MLASYMGLGNYFFFNWIFQTVQNKTSKVKCKEKLYQFFYDLENISHFTIAFRKGKLQAVTATATEEFL